MPDDKKHAPHLNIEPIDVNPLIVSYDKEVFLASIAISLKRIADVQTAGLVELPLKHGGTVHIRASEVGTVTMHGRYKDEDITFIQMKSDTGEDGFAITLSVGEVMERLWS